MSRYPAPRELTITLADLRRCTILERARALAAAGVDERDANRLLAAVSRHDAQADMIERGVTLMYAIAWQLERRLDPGLSWDQAQTWQLALDLTDTAADPLEDAAAVASVEAAIATGLPPAIAGELTLAQVEAYGTVRKAAERRTGRRGRRR